MAALKQLIPGCFRFSGVGGPAMAQEGLDSLFDYDQIALMGPSQILRTLPATMRRIREIADEYNIPIMPNPPLARALHATVEVGDEIPAEHYKAVAEIIGYVFRLKGKLPGRRAAR